MNLYAATQDSILDVKLDKRTEIFNWGIDNLYPQTIERLVDSSVTSKLAVDLAAKSIYGKSFGSQGRMVVNKEGQTLNQILRIASLEYAKHTNCFIHFGYNADLKIKSIKVLPSVDMRTGKADDKEYSGKVVYYTNWDRADGNVNKKGFKLYDRYNPSENVIKAQIEAAGGILKYSGQVMHLKGDANTVYGLSDLNSVLHEALLEANSQKFRATNSENGFLATKVMVVKPFAKEEERNSFKRTIKGLQGAENTAKILLLESSNPTESLDEQIKLEDLTSGYDDKLFEYSDTMAEKNICKAFNVPVFLVSSNDSGIFGNSGELIKQGRVMLYESQEETRDMFQEAFSGVLANWKDDITEEVVIVNPYQTTEIL